MFGDPRRSMIISYSAIFIGLITVGSWISIPFVPVPITLQSFFVLLSGTVMKRYAVVPTGLYVLCGALGLPVFHNGTTGIGVLLGPTGGYIFGFVSAALVVGIAYETSSVILHIGGLIAGTLIIYIFGVSWISLSTGIPFTVSIILGMLLFLPGDVVKGFAVYQVAKRLHGVDNVDMRKVQEH
jgi:biotin transport system substrate-specific component